MLGLLLYGVGRNLTGNTFQALLTDRFAAGVPRARTANLYEVVKILGLVVGAGLLGLALSSGLAAASLLAQAVELTSAPSAGLLLGVWGLGFQLGRALASVIGAGIVDLMNLVTVDAPLLAYGAAFAGEAALLIGALLTYGRLRMRAARVLSAS